LLTVADEKIVCRIEAEAEPSEIFDTRAAWHNEPSLRDAAAPERGYLRATDFYDRNVACLKTAMICDPQIVVLIECD
jgi:hypothetical protein